MEELLARHNSKIVGFTRGQKIEATLREINPKSAIFNVGGKGEGVLTDIYFQEAKDYIKGVKVGDIVTATVIDPETSDGSVLLSLRHAAHDSLWETLEKAMKEELDLSVLVKNVTSAGIIVEYSSVMGFIPVSQIGKKFQGKLQDLLNKQIKVKVLDIDRERRKAVFSEKYVSEADEVKRIKHALSQIKESAVYDGKVTTVVDFGAFIAIPVDVEGHGKVDVEGLVHLSELSWEKVSNPAEFIAVGDVVKVKVIGLRDGKLALSMKQAQEDPWKDAANKYHVDDRVKGTVYRQSDYGVLVQLEPGIEGLIHITKIPPATKLKNGDSVNCYIEEIDAENKKISLGLVLTSKPVAYK